MLERFSDRGRQVMVLAKDEAGQLGHGFIGTEHLLLGLLREGDNVAAEALNAAGITLDGSRSLVIQAIGDQHSAGGNPPFTPRTKKVLELSLRQCINLGHSHIGPEHLLLGLIAEGNGVAVEVIRANGVVLGALRHDVLLRMGSLEGHELHDAPLTLAVRTEGPQFLGEQWRRRLVACSFCGRRAPATGRIVPGRTRHGDGAYICEHCIKWWAGALEGPDADPGDHTQSSG